MLRNPLFALLLAACGDSDTIVALGHDTPKADVDVAPPVLSEGLQVAPGGATVRELSNSGAGIYAVTNGGLFLREGTAWQFVPTQGWAYPSEVRDLVSLEDDLWARYLNAPVRSSDGGTSADGGTFAANQSNIARCRGAADGSTSASSASRQ